MANSYLQFSCAFGLTSDDEISWLEEKLGLIKQITSGDIDEEEEGKALEKLGPELTEVISTWDQMDFSYQVKDHELWIYADESGNPDQVADFLHAFVKKFRPNDALWFEWAAWMDRMRVNEFGGGACVINAHKIEWMNTSDWARHKAEKMSNGGKSIETNTYRKGE